MKGNALCWTGFDFGAFPKWLPHCCCCSVTKSRQTLCDPTDCSTDQASLSFTIFWGLLKLMSTESVMPSNHLILCQPLLLLPSIFPSIRDFSNESILHTSNITRSEYTNLTPSYFDYSLLSIFDNKENRKKIFFYWSHKNSCVTLNRSLSL